ncbi:hypothetical protein M1558_01230, partial [Candidatus Parvarchaeota archaeon]|nr:hypothetical protein [Candidatus Parvarchaeota archaeon]
SNCTTTFSETGLPSSQQWQVTFNGTTKSNSTGSAIKIKTNNTANAQVYYTAIAKSDNLACVSYNTPSVRLGSSYTFSAWNCTTTFSETGLPSDQQTQASKAGNTNPAGMLLVVSGQLWQVSSYDGASSSLVDTGSTASITQTDITTVSDYSATAKSGTISCVSNPSITAEQGSNDNTFTTWQCTTTFTETGLPSAQNWNTTYAGTSAINNTGKQIAFTQSGITTVSSYNSEAYSSNLNCNSYNSPSILQGSNYQFSAWNCTTTFSETGLPSSQQWYATYDGTLPTVSTGSPTSVKQNDITTVSSYTGEGYSSNLNCNSYNTPSLLQGSSYTFSAWNCITTFSETGLPSSQQWYATYDGTLPTVSTGSPTSVKQNDITTVSSYTGEGYSSNLNCNSYNTPSLLQGSSYTFSAWNCTTTFVDTGSSTGMQQFATQWTIKWNGQRGEGVNSNEIQFSDKDVSSVGTYSYQQPFTQNNALCVGNSGNAEMGTTVDLGANWECYTMIVGNQVFSEFPLPNSAYSQTLSYGNNQAIDNVVYDPQNNLFYVALISQDIAVINDSNDAEVALIPPPYSNAYPAVLTYANGLVFVLNTVCPPANSCSTSSTVNVISGTKYLSANTSISGGDITFSMGFNPIANTLWIPTYTSSGTAEIAIVSADSSATLVNYLGNPWAAQSDWAGNPVYDPNNKEMYVSGSYYNDVSSAQAEIAAYWASNGSCQDCTIDLSSAIGSNVWTQQYIPFRIYNVGHSDFIFAGTGGSDNTIAMLNLSNINTIPTFTLDDNRLDSYYDGAYNSGYAFSWSWFYTVSCSEGSNGGCTSDPTLYGTSTENPGLHSLSIGLNNNDTSGAIGGVVTDPVTVKFESSGLPSNTPWSVTYAGYTESTSSQNLTFAVAPENSYSYSIPAICADNDIFSASTSLTTSGTASPGNLVKISWITIGQC